MHYLPFWLGGLVLGGVCVWLWLLEGRTLGVTGQVTRLVEALADPEAEQEAVEFSMRDPDDVLAALAAATAAEIGIEVDAPKYNQADGSRLDMQRHVPLQRRVLFLVCIALGAMAAALWDGSFALRFDFGAAHTALTGDGWQRVLLLLGGGIAVGFGTRMCGGCTSGHGLSGCARMVPRSLLATGIFLGTAILFTLATNALLGS
ncbi:YeeE/YedE family protein [Pseudenhygromyxa sp. WMMC2535]|uniref:YeeE/YedE thiosulfate transporter family protein n=1 Tax=Pseudenhygromyxa sp. WMMC2535 TaxID=2712867 RepID=UPI0015543CFE|nr:YeeE/YedE family protein [Pseudenhygromyxa sp. WMMC2535]